MEELNKYIDVFNVDFSTIPLDSRYKGVIVEPREHPMLELVLKNFVFMMKGWSLVVYHSKENEQYLLSILGENHNVKTVCFTDSNIHIQDYNNLLMSKEFWSNVGGERVLVFQTDSFIRKRNIDKYLEYDYVGAPWAPNTIIDKGNLELSVSIGSVIENHTINVGNGGLSLRNPNVMLKIIDMKELEPWRHMNEDIFFSVGIYCMECNRCPMDIARSFSVETIFHHDPFGWHKAYNYWNGSHWDILKSISPI
jgi:hypothetical protein